MISDQGQHRLCTQDVTENILSLLKDLVLSETDSRLQEVCCFSVTCDLTLQNK
jgi:hypothetical protein